MAPPVKPETLERHRAFLELRPTDRPLVTDPTHPATEGLASPFKVHDEIYLYKGFDRNRVHMLLSFDRHPNTGEPGCRSVNEERNTIACRISATTVGFTAGSGRSDRAANRS